MVTFVPEADALPVLDGDPEFDAVEELVAGGGEELGVLELELDPQPASTTATSSTAGRESRFMGRNIPRQAAAGAGACPTLG
jgi:hypothetical protein